MSAAALIPLLAVAVLAADAEMTPSHHHDATVHHSFDDVDHWVKIFDDPERDAWQKPDAVVRAPSLTPGMTVADLGAGTGYFSRHLSAGVGANGSVLAVDVEPNLVEYIRRRAEKEGTPNVTPILASEDNPRLPAGTVDVILIVDSLHHIDARPDYLRRLRRALKPGGRIAVIDFKKEESSVGPPPEHRLAREVVMSEFALAGYRFVEEPAFLQYQYFLVFQ